MDTTDHCGVEKKKGVVGKDACLSLKTKLPKTFSESDIKTAQNASNEIKTLTKPIATLAAAGGLEYTIQDQQKTLVLTEITNLTPIGLLSKQQSYYLLGSPSQVQEIHEKQPKVIFSIPPDPRHLPKHHETDDVLLTLLMKNSSMESLLKNETYHEMNDLHLKKANSDWLTNQEARYAVSQMFAGCILLDGTKAILINCVEPEKGGLIPITKDIQRMIAIHPFQIRTVITSKSVSNSLNPITQTSL